MKKSDCTITTFVHNPNIQRGVAVKVYHTPTLKTYIYYGYHPRLLLVTEDTPSYYHPTKFTNMQAEKFIKQLGDKL